VTIKVKVNERLSNAIQTQNCISVKYFLSELKHAKL
jgi:hypothetical protein